MRSGAKRLWALCLLPAVCGCVGQSSFVDSPPLPARPRPAPSPETIVDLRIRAEEVPAEPAAAAPPPSAEIPLVPVPPPPLKGDRPSEPVPALPLAKVAPVYPEMLTPRQVLQKAAASYASYDSYIARLTRREAGRTNHAEEIMKFSFRKNPWSIHFKWLSGPGKGREVLYVKGRYENKLHTLLTAGDVPLVPAGRRMALAIDGPLVRMANRHPITDAGFGAMIDKASEVLAANERGNFRTGKVTSLGLRQRPDFQGPLYVLEIAIPPGVDDDVPQGGRRVLGFTPDQFLPVLSELFDHKGQEFEYSRFDRIMLGVKLDDVDFDPEQMGKGPEARENPVAR